jgi:hypothetical protein
MIYYYLLRKGLTWKRTCEACPEQYDIFKEGVQVGYFRLRHGHLTVTCPGVMDECVYASSDFQGDGDFLRDKERKKHQRKAEKKIRKWLKRGRKNMISYYFLQKYLTREKGLENE